MIHPWKELLEHIQALPLWEKRTLSDDYLEVVIENKDFGQWSENLSRYFGPALKPPGAAPSKEAKKVVQNFGGIRKEQTLFYRAFDEVAIAAMFWPWSNDRNSTLKMWLCEPG